MDSGFLAKVPKGVIAIDPNGDALNPGFFPRHGIEDLCLIALAFGIPQVHAEEHLRPILRLGSPRSRMDGEQGAAAVVLLEEQTLQLGLFKALGQRGQGTVELCADVLSFCRQLGQDLDFFLLILQPGEGGDIAFEFFSFLLKELRLLLVLPGFRC